MHKFMVRSLAVLAAASFILIPSGVALADSYVVSAEVQAPLPPDLPVIMTPDDNSVQTSPQVLITGSCTIVVPTLIVVLIRDNDTIGSGLCSSTGTFSIMVGLVLGDNIIKVKFMTITGESGGFGEPILLKYNPPTVLINDPDEATTSKPIPTAEIPANVANYNPLALKLDYDFVTYTTSSNTPVKITVGGGRGPYKVTIYWGDTSYTTETVDEPGSFIVNHLYRNIPNQSMKLLIKIVDADGTVTEGQRALVNFEKTPGTATLEAVAKPTNNDKTLAIWFTSTVGVTLVATIVYSTVYASNVAGGAAHSAVRAKRLRLKRTRPLPRGKK